jgi:hypothetical protein
MFNKSIASEGKLVFRRAWDARASSQSGRLDLLGRPMPKLDEDEEPGFQESVIPSVGKRTAREAHRRYRQRRRRFDPELPFKIGPMNGREAEKAAFG